MREILCVCWPLCFTREDKKKVDPLLPYLLLCAKSLILNIHIVIVAFTTNLLFSHFIEFFGCNNMDKDRYLKWCLI